MDDRRLAFLRELERADEEVAATLSELDELYAETEAVRKRALELEAFFGRLPDEREAAAVRIERAKASVAEARAAAGAAAEELRAAEAAGDEKRIAAARRLDVRAHDALGVAERRLRELEAAAARLEEEANAAEREALELEERARALARTLAERPRLAREAGDPPGAGLEGISEWGTRARAALLVSRSQLASEREAVLRQANELGTLVLGRPLAATSAARVARLVESEL